MKITVHDDDQATLEFFSASREMPTVQEALAALQFAANKINGMRINSQRAGEVTDGYDMAG